jgi:AraC-like DNA-binding protein
VKPETVLRGFADATGLAPLAYVQRLRIEDAKRRLERTGTAVDENKLASRLRGYRRRFQIPEFARG